MKKTVLLLALGSLLFVNVSFVGMPVVQAQAQSTSGTIISSVISTIISVISDIFGGDDKKYKSPEPDGSQDCHDELTYYYKLVRGEDETMEKLYVGFSQVKFGNMIQPPPTDYNISVRQYYRENNHAARIICSGEATATSCTPRSLTCEEQNP